MDELVKKINALAEKCADEAVEQLPVGETVTDLWFPLEGDWQALDELIEAAEVLTESAVHALFERTYTARLNEYRLGMRDREPNGRTG